MASFLAFFSLIGSLLGGIIILLTISQAGSAPQEAAGYAMACAFAVVPYVLARSVGMMSDDAESRQIRLTKAAEDSQRALEDIKRHLTKE